MDLLYRDGAVAAFAKPSGLAVHRGWAPEADVALSRASEALSAWVFPVHRLDRGTSGVLVFALDRGVAHALAGQFERGEVRKRYLALVRGVPPAHGVIDHALAQKPGGLRVPAVTEFARLGVWERFALVEACPRSGRLHQIRRHLKHLSHPIVGDVNYGRGEINRMFRTRFGLHRLALHAAELAFVHPVSGAPFTVSAPVPPDLAEPLRTMGLPVTLPDA
jgi:tRNA pseudouridine65 synthase